MLRDKKNLLIVTLASVAFLTTGALAIYTWHLNDQLEELRTSSSPASSTKSALLDKLEDVADQDAAANLQPSSIDPFAGLGNDPFAAMQQMQKQMDELFNSATGGSNFSFGGSGFGGFSTPLQQPEIEVEESDDEYRVVISVAKGTDLDLSTDLEDNTLSISAQIRSEQHASNGGTQSSSTSMSQFSRSIMLDEPVDATGMKTQKNEDEVVISIPKVG